MIAKGLRIYKKAMAKTRTKVIEKALLRSMTKVTGIALKGMTKVVGRTLTDLSKSIVNAL